MKKIILILIISAIGFTGCTKSSKAGDTSELNSLIFASVLSGDDNPSKRYCLSAVYIMNQCVGTGGGFEPAVMCSSSQLSTHTLANYQALVQCTSAAVNTTYCNFPQNRVAIASAAVTNFFSTCDTPTGIIKSGLRP